MAIAALEQLHAWQIPRVAAELATLTARIAAKAEQLGLDPLSQDHRGPHMLGIQLPEAARSDILSAMAAVELLRRRARGITAHRTPPARKR